MSDPVLTDSCEICGEQNPKTLHRHHVVPEGKGGQDIPANRVRLCANCHNAIHRIYDDAYYERLQRAIGELEVNTAEGELGHEIADHMTKDRRLPNGSPHVRQHRISPSNEVVDAVIDGEVDTGGAELVRLYACGYCDRVFDPREQSNIATHLQRNHGVSNPYEGDSGVKLADTVAVDTPDTDIGVDEDMPPLFREAEGTINGIPVIDGGFTEGSKELLREWVGTADIDRAMDRITTLGEWRNEQSDESDENEEGELDQ